MIFRLRVIDSIGLTVLFNSRSGGKAKKPVLTLFTKDVCPLCDEAKHELRDLLPLVELQSVNIEEDSELYKKYRYAMGKNSSMPSMMIIVAELRICVIYLQIRHSRVPSERPVPLQAPRRQETLAGRTRQALKEYFVTFQLQYAPGRNHPNRAVVYRGNPCDKVIVIWLLRKFR